MELLVAFVVALAGVAHADPVDDRCWSIEGARRSLNMPHEKEADIRYGDERIPRGVLRRIGPVLTHCPHSEGTWYALLRARELLSCDPEQTLGLATRALSSVPSSAWIATVRARALGTVAAAEAAIALDPKHLPAQLALANALIDAGEIARAREIVEGMGRAKVVPREEIRARLALASHRWRDVFRGESNEGRFYDSSFVEPVAGDWWPWLVNQIWALADAKRGKVREAARSLGWAIEAGSLPELRDAVLRGDEAAVRLMHALQKNVEKGGIDAEWPSVQLARLEIIAGNVDHAVSLITEKPASQIKKVFCARLPELLWHAPSIKEKTPDAPARLRALCAGIQEEECALVPP
jgi:hypothetical protein